MNYRKWLGWILLAACLAGCAGGKADVPPDLPVVKLQDLKGDELKGMTQGAFPGDKIIYLPEKTPVRFTLKLEGDILSVRGGEVDFEIEALTPVYVYLTQHQAAFSVDNRNWKNLHGFASGTVTVGMSNTPEAGVHGNVVLKANLRK